jgi:hypothetical protein
VRRANRLLQLPQPEHAVAKLRAILDSHDRAPELGHDLDLLDRRQAIAGIQLDHVGGMEPGALGVGAPADGQRPLEVGIRDAHEDRERREDAAGRWYVHAAMVP